MRRSPAELLIAAACSASFFECVIGFHHSSLYGDCPRAAGIGLSGLGANRQNKKHEPPDVSQVIHIPIRALSL